MRLLLIEICNYVDYPTGGHLSFVRNMLRAFGNDLALVGCSTDDCPVGVWTKREIGGVQYDYFSVATVKKTSHRPLIPARLKDFFAVLKYRNRILEQKYDYIFIQTPEVLFALPPHCLSRSILRMPGVENPLAISRYAFARPFSKVYDWAFFYVAKKVRTILVTANQSEIDAFVVRSQGVLKEEALVKYPTRYDEQVFCVVDKLEVRAKLKLAASQIMVTTVGRLGWFKGWKFMIDAFVLFKNQYESAHFYYIGDGEDQLLIEQYIKDINMEESVSLLGRLLPRKIAEYLNASDLFIMGSYKEGWSTTLVEACACGVPCVVTGFSSSEMVVDGENGYVVELRSEDLFAKKMEEAIRLERKNVIHFNAEFVKLSVQYMRQSITEAINP